MINIKTIYNIMEINKDTLTDIELKRIINYKLLRIIIYMENDTDEINY